MSAVIQSVVSVEPYGENLSVVTTSEGYQVIANKRDDGSFRWSVDEPVVYVSEGSIIPEDVLKERGYWDTEKDRGLLDGGPRNRVKMKKLAGFESRGLLFKVGSPGEDWTDDNQDPEVIGWILREGLQPEKDTMYVKMGQDVTEFFGITEFTG